jgi:metal-dependent amidase/aminoacylase/carboxypeptidase family protein
MPSELENNIRAAAEKMAKALADASELTVETKYVEIDPQNPNNLEKALLVAKTVIKLDGDQEMTVPMKRGESGALELDEGLLEIHQQNVANAIEYRSSSLETLLSYLPGRGR